MFWITNLKEAQNKEENKTMIRKLINCQSKIQKLLKLIKKMHYHQIKTSPQVLVKIFLKQKMLQNN